MKKEEIIERYGIEEYERRLQANRERNRGNPQYKAYKSEYQKEWQKKNRDKVNAWNREYRKKNPQKARAIKLADNYKRKDQAKGYDISENVSGDWIMENIFTSSCFYCGDSDWEHLGCDRIDNTKPHAQENCVCACGLCNIEREDNYTVEEFKQYRESHPRGISLIDTLKPKIVKENGKTILKKIEI